MSTEASSSKHKGRPVTEKGEPVFECQDCGKFFLEEDLDTASHVWQRIEDGEPMCHYQCPDCGALCRESDGDPVDVLIPDDAQTHLIDHLQTHWGHELTVIGHPKPRIVCQTCGNKETYVMPAGEISKPEERT